MTCPTTRRPGPGPAGFGCSQDERFAVLEAEADGGLVTLRLRHIPLEVKGLAVIALPAASWPKSGGAIDVLSDGEIRVGDEITVG